MKKIKNNFSNSNSKYKNLSKEELKEKKPRFEFLYENSSILRKKMDLIRAKNYYNEQEQIICNYKLIKEKKYGSKNIKIYLNEKK